MREKKKKLLTRSGAVSRSKRGRSWWRDTNSGLLLA